MSAWARPTRVLQKVKAPIRIFYQMSTLRFFPVVNTEFYQDWKDLNGQEIAVHSRGSGTEAIMQLMAKRNGIDYSNISYVPGSEVRATALLQGHVKATIVDSTNWRIIQDKGGDKFKLLAIENVDATDEALYANTEFLEQRAGGGRHPGRGAGPAPGARSTRTRPWSSSCAPSTTSCRTCPTISRPRSCPTSRARSPAALFPNNGGGAEAAKADFEFNALAGKLEGDPATPRGRGFLGARAAEPGRRQARAGLSGAAPRRCWQPGRPRRRGRPRPSWLWRLLSVAIVALAWEIAGRIPISFAFPTFSATMSGLRSA